MVISVKNIFTKNIIYPINLFKYRFFHQPKKIPKEGYKIEISIAKKYCEFPLY